MSVCPLVRPSQPMQFLNNLMDLNESYRKSLVPNGKVHSGIL